MGGRPRRPAAVIDVNAKTVLRFALVGQVATAGVAAAQPASPDDASSDDRRGPPDELPGPVPDFVRDVLDAIGEKLSGALSGQELGETLSGLLGGGGDAAALAG
jgi:hypothetical protein